LIYMPPHMPRKPAAAVLTAEVAPVAATSAAMALPQIQPPPRARSDFPLTDPYAQGGSLKVPAQGDVSDDRGSITLGAPVLLIVENDTAFARFLLDAAPDQGFKGMATSLGVPASRRAHD